MVLYTAITNIDVLKAIVKYFGVAHRYNLCILREEVKNGYDNCALSFKMLYDNVSFRYGKSTVLTNASVA